MTRDEAIKELELIAKVTIWNDRREAVEMAIEALTYQNLSKPNNTCEVDLISREDAMGAVQDHFNADGFKGYYDGQKMMDRITALPSAGWETSQWAQGVKVKTIIWGTLWRAIRRRGDTQNVNTCKHKGGEKHDYTY